MNKPEPPPIKNNHPAVWDLVLNDMKERDEIGKQKYNTRLQPFNGRDPLVDAYQEVLDLVVYLRQAIYERDYDRNCPPCMVCGKPATNFVREVIVLPPDENGFKNLKAGLIKAGCDDHPVE